MSVLVFSGTIIEMVNSRFGHPRDFRDRLKLALRPGQRRSRRVDWDRTAQE